MDCIPIFQMDLCTCICNAYKEHVRLGMPSRGLDPSTSTLLELGSVIVPGYAPL